MVPALANKQQLPAVYNNSPPRARQPSVGLMGSIWAPQPQLSDTTWPKALDSFSIVSGKEGSPAAPSEVRNLSLQQPVVTGEEAFGPTPQGTLRAPIRDVGAIGDGRKKNTPDHGDSVCAYICLLNLSVKLTFIQHVEQLLRTLNLNSPTPLNKPSIFALNIESSPSSPDFSPASVSSALLTPTDLSPARPFDVKLHSPYDHVPSGHPYLSQSSLLMENHSPVKNQDALISNPVAPRSPLVQLNHLRQQAPSNNFPFFEFSEPLSSRTASGIQLNSVSPHHNVALYNTPVAPRRMDARVSAMDWRMNSLMQHHQIHQPSNQDWHLAIEKSTPDYLPNAIGGGLAQEEPLRASFVYQQPPAAQPVQTPHEVRSYLHITILMC